MTAHGLPQHLLLAEDSPADARLLEIMLREGGWNGRLETFTRLGDLLARLDQPPKPDLALVDLGLPDSQGLEAVDRFVAAGTPVPMVVLTGLDDEGAGLEAVKRGAQDYLIKGTLPAPLLRRALRYAVERHRLLREVLELRAMLPICANCKQVRNDKGYWQDIHGYLNAHPEVLRMSHGICPDCAHGLYGDLATGP